MNARVVVGDDGSIFAAAAVRWAAAEASLRGATLCVIGPRADDEIIELLRDQSVEAEMLVLGAAGCGSDALGGTQLGAVTRALLRSSGCPVVVVQPGPPRPSFQRIVVGVDGSPSATAALDWAAQEANLRCAELVVIHAWWHGLGDRSLGSCQSRDFARLDAALIAQRGADMGRRRGLANVRGVTIEGDPVRSILDAADRADLIVLGSRNERTSRLMLYGSVSGSVLTRAYCPVVTCKLRQGEPTGRQPVGVTAVTAPL